MRLAPERGFAIPLTIYVVTIVTILIALGLARASADHRAAGSSDDGVAALAIAQSGLDNYLSTLNLDVCNRAIRPLDGDSVRYNLNGGYADVIARVILRPVDSMNAWTYVVRSTGRVVAPAQGKDPQAVRTVAQFARWQRNWINVLAAFTAVGGVSDADSDTDGELRGVDQHYISSCRRSNVHAARTHSSEDFDVNSDWQLSGLSPHIYESGSKTTVGQATKIDWANTINGTLKPDYTSLQLWNSSYPVMFIDGDLVITTTTTTYAYGTLIVRGKLKIRGNYMFQYYGIVLVGDEIEFEANDQRFDGMVVSGLNVLLGQNPSDSDPDEGYIDIDYDSYYILRAAQALAGFVPIQNSVVDNWASY